MVVDEDDEDLIDLLEKNNSSVIIRFSIAGDGYLDKCRFLTGGDAGVAIWERLWDQLEEYDRDWLSYDIMETPHHCSWRTLSHDRWSKLGEKVKVSERARKARYRRFLAEQVGMEAPTRETEAEDPAKARQFYAACYDYIRLNTYDTEKYRILFNENIGYG